MPDPTNPAAAGTPPFLQGGGEMGRLIRGKDWTCTPLGPVEDWPASLKAALSICLHSSFPTAIYWGPDLRLLYNDAWAPIPAGRHPWALGRPAREVWSDIWDVVAPDFRRVVETGEGVTQFDQMLPIVRDGQARETYWNYSLTPLLAEDGHVAGVFNQGNETTGVVMARREAEAELRRFGHLFEQAPGAVAILRGPDHVIEIANPAYLALVGNRDIQGKPVAQALPEVVEQGFVALLDKVWDSGETYRGTAIPVSLNRGGITEIRHLDFVYQPVVAPSGERQGIFVQATDVSERVRAEQALRDSEARYEAIVNSIDQMIWSTLPDGFHDYYNDRWYEYTGVPYGSTDGEGWNGMFHPDDQDRAWKVWRHSLETGEPYHIEYRLRHRSGEYRWVIGRAQCVRDGEGRIVRWYGTCTDVHDLKMAEEARQLLLRELNHRVKNLFTIATGMISMTARSATSPQEMAVTLKGRLMALAKAHALIRIGESGVDAPREVPLEALLREILRPHLDAGRRDQVRLNGPEVLLGERTSTGLALILHELATNAAKYGALAAADGRLAVGWRVEGERLRLDWTEHLPAGGVTRPSQPGFGSSLAQSTVRGQLRGTIAVDWADSGIAIALEMPAEGLRR